MESRNEKSGSQGIWSSIVEFFNPISSENKKKRRSQLYNFSIFLVASAVFFYFENHIENFVKTEVSELHKGIGHPGPAPF